MCCSLHLHIYSIINSAYTGVIVFILQQNLSEQQTADPPIPESSVPPCSPANDVTHAVISEEIDIADFLPKPPSIPDSGALTQALHDIGSDLLQFPQKPHPTDSHIRLGQNVSEVLESVPVPSQYGQASKSSFLLGQLTPEVSVGQPKASVHGHPSQSSVHLGDSTASGRNNPDPLGVKQPYTNHSRANM